MDLLLLSLVIPSSPVGAWLFMLVGFEDSCTGTLLAGRGGNPAQPRPLCRRGAADTDADGLYDDVNGNGRIDFADVVWLFTHL